MKGKMKRRLAMAATALSLVLSQGLTVFAEPEVMPDGTVFDAEYYAQANPDVAAAFGTDTAALYQHYVKYGKAEGRLPVSPTAKAADDSSDSDAEENTFRATVDGTEMTFYLEKTNVASDGYELNFISFTQEGKEKYKLYFRIPSKTEAGSYSNGKFYFDIYTSYNKDTGKWGNAYKAVYDGKGQPGVHKSKFSGNWGSYTLTLDQYIGGETKEISGTLTAVLEGYSSSTDQKKISIDNGVFEADWGEVHEKVQQWKNGTLTDNSQSWTDPYAGTGKQEKVACRKCGGTGKKICGSCDGAGTLLRRGNSVDLGSGSTGYTYEVDCPACNGGYISCSWCGGKGYEYK